MLKPSSVYISSIENEKNIKPIPLYNGYELVHQHSIENQNIYNQLKHFLDSLQCKYDDKNSDTKPNNKGQAWFFAFGLTCLAGFVCAFLDGIDGIASIVQLLPLSAIFSALVVSSFVFISITVFIGFDVTEAAKLLNIDINFRESSPFDYISTQKQMIHDINRYLEREIAEAVSKETLIATKANIENLIRINDSLDAKIKAVDLYMINDPLVFWWKNFAAVSCTLLYLNFGFFTGQAGLLYLLGNISMAVVMTQPWLAALVIGGACMSAFGYAAFYWLVQRPGVENLICKTLYGVDLETLELVQSDEKQSHLSSALESKQKLLSKLCDTTEPENKSESVWQSHSCLFSSVNSAFEKNRTPGEVIAFSQNI